MAVERRECHFGGKCRGKDYLLVCRPCLLDRFEELALKHFHFGDIETLRKFKRSQIDAPYDEKV